MNSLKNKLNTALKISLVVVALTNSMMTADSSHHHDQKCATYVKKLLNNNCAYLTLYNTLSPNVSAISALLYAVHLDSANYPALLTFCETLADTLSTGNIIVTDPDGLVVVDTSADGANTYDNYQAGTISPNQMTSISFIDSQGWPCGLGVETKYNNPAAVFQNNVVIRLDIIPGSNVGDYSYLNSLGSVNMSVTMGEICL